MACRLHCKPPLRLAGVSNPSCLRLPADGHGEPLCKTSVCIHVPVSQTTGLLDLSLAFTVAHCFCISRGIGRMAQ